MFTGLWGRGLAWVAVHEPLALFRGKTTVWVSDEVAQGIIEYQNDGGKEAQRYIDKVEHYSKGGFGAFEGDSRGIRSKGSTWPGIMAIEPWATLFRLYGFYEQPQRTDFIVPSCTMKTRGKMNRKDKKECDFAYEIKTTGNWEKADEQVPEGAVNEPNNPGNPAAPKGVPGKP